MVDQPVCRRHRHRLIHEDAAPGAERMVARDDQAPSFVPVRAGLPLTPGIYTQKVIATVRAERRLDI